jgi:hypothetical protein
MATYIGSTPRHLTREAKESELNKHSKASGRLLKTISHNKTMVASKTFIDNSKRA